nr:uncharacterized protein LOC113737437 [Coffea arabica]
MATSAALHPQDGGHPISMSRPSFQHKSFSSLFSSKDGPTLELQTDKTTRRGEPAVVFSPLDVSKFAASFQLSLVGKFSKGRPPMEDIRRFFKALDLKDEFSVGLLDHRHVLIRLASEKDFRRLWGRNVWYVFGCPMRVFKWASSFHVDKEPSIVPVWFSLPKLPVHFFKKECLFHMVTCLERPLFMDAATSSLACPSMAPRVCAKVDLFKPLPKRVWVGVGMDEANGFWQVLEPENMPSYCSFCFRQGHAMDGCHVKNPELRAALPHGGLKRQETVVAYRPKQAGVGEQEGGKLRAGVNPSGAVVAGDALPAASTQVVPASAVAASAIGDLGAALVLSQATAAGMAEGVSAAASPGQSPSAQAIASPVRTAEKVDNQIGIAHKALVSGNVAAVPCMPTDKLGELTASGLPVSSGTAATFGVDQGGEETGGSEEALMEMAFGSEVEEGGVHSAEQVAGYLSPRGEVGGVQRGASSLFIDIFNLDPIVQQVQGKVRTEEGVKAITKLKHKGDVQLFRVKLNMDGCIVNSEGSLSVFFQKSLVCEHIGESSQHLSIKIHSQLLSEPMVFSFVHAKCTGQERVLLWAALLVDNPMALPWFLVRDFNMIVSEEEKRGGLSFRLEEGLDFISFMARAGVQDAGFSGSRFTWCNNRGGRAHIWKRLDRMLFNQVAAALPFNFQVQHLGRDPSDHAPLLLSAITRLDNKPRAFWFLNFWTSKPELLEVIRRGWEGSFSGPPLQRLASKLRQVKKHLQSWSREQFGNIFDAVRVAEERASMAEAHFDDNPSKPKLLALQEARAVLRNAFCKEESQVNSKDANGVWLTEESQIAIEAVHFFESLFTAEPCLGSWDTLGIIPKVISHDQNEDLVRAPSLEEVREVVFAMNGESAPGPDDFTGKFFSFAWDVVAHDVYEAVGSFFYGAEVPKSITVTLVVLIPKVSAPQDFSQFRPISLYNFINKVLSKVLAVRLAKVMPCIISPQQSGFVKGRPIFDNFLLAQEIVSGIGKSSRWGNIVLKLDMAKAYDRVSSLFLLQVLRRFGFSEVWIDMVWRLISNVWFLVIINGVPQGFFKSGQGIRQGDPLLPSLFVIGAEVLSRLLNSLIGQWGFVPFKVPLGCPVVTHLAYANDVIIFSSGMKKSLQLIIKALEDYEMISG